MGETAVLFAPHTVDRCVRILLYVHTHVVFRTKRGMVWIHIVLMAPLRPVKVDYGSNYRYRTGSSIITLCATGSSRY